MKPTDDLFILIKSLTKSEKRYFRIVADRHAGDEGTDYLQIFDLLDRMDSYDEQYILKTLGKEKGKYFPQAKYYLYNTLLKALNQYGLKNSPDAQLNELMESAMTLYNRKLLDQCRKVLAKAEKLAIRENKELRLMEIMVLQYRVLLSDTPTADMEKEIERIFGTMMSTSETLATRNKFWNIQVKMFLAVKNNSDRSLERCRELLDDPILLQGETVSDPMTRIMYYYIQDSYHDAARDFEGAYRIRKNIVEFIESTPILMVNPLDRYVPSLYNYCQALIQTYRFQEFDKQYSKLRAVVAEGRRTAPHYNDLHIQMLEPRRHLELGYPEKARELMAALEEEFFRTRTSMRIGFVIYFMYLYAYISFAAEDYPVALRWVNEILNDRDTSVHERLHVDARILNLMTHYELGNLEVLDSYGASAARFIAKRERISELKKFAIDLVRKMSSTTSRKELRLILADSQKKIGEMGGDINISFDFASWIESKIGDTKMAEVMREKAKKRIKD